MMCPSGQDADTARTLATVPADSEHLAGARFPRPDPTTTTSFIHSSSVNDVAMVMVTKLTSRGIDQAFARKLVEEHDADRIDQAVLYFDGLTDVGPGMLVTAIRAGRSPRPVRLQGDAGRGYSMQIRSWLNQNFPEFKQASGDPHPGAVAAVLRLHFEYGKGSLTKGEHGPVVREAVRAFDRKWVDA